MFHKGGEEGHSALLVNSNGDVDEGGSFQQGSAL